jgi:exodeoxyribonuclease V gamma subunit
MFSVTFSNRCENLLEALLARLAADRRGPFNRRQVLVPGSALRRRIELAVADRESVCANVDFDYLAQWLWQQIGCIVDVPEASPYAPSALVWRIFTALDGPWVQGHERLARYLQGADARMRFDLAQRLARLFDHYLCYRPQWLERWAAGEAGSARMCEADSARADEAWQGELWRQIHGSSANTNADADGKAFSLPFLRFLRQAAQMDDATLAGIGLPASICVFGLPTLPPLYLEVLRVLARVMDVHLYVLNPCREYWFDIVDARSLSWLSRRQQNLFFDTGNKLLAAWGKQAQAHIESLFEGEHPVLEDAAFTPHPARHLLARLHNAILDLQELEAGSVHLDEDNSDRSIELHLCHSRIRELEVLHDRLLGLFKGQRSLLPAEVVVLTPDLAACAPLIEAVFGTAPPGRHIPWRITGLGSTEENLVAQVLDWLLVLAAGRAPASRVFDLLQQPLVAAHFGLDEAGLEQIRTWMEGAGIRWGLDAEQARAVGTSGAHTVEKGLARLFLSWAAGEAADRALFAGHVGAAFAPQGSAGLALGAFWRYTSSLSRLRTSLLEAHDAESWRGILLGALAALMGEAAERAEDMRSVREAINALADDMAAGLGAANPAAIPLEVIHAALVDRLDEGARGGVPGGGVTFSALPALRGLPYRVVCVIGLDYDAFPGRDHADEFDLMALHPQKGDRQRRIDERNLFLDVILSARDVLHLSCIGRSARDNTELPPSVLVDEMFDLLAVACAENPKQPASLAAARKRLTVEHPLQAFSPDYFVSGKDGRLENFRSEFADALTHRQRRQSAAGAAAAGAPAGGEGTGTHHHASPFFTTPLPSPDENWRRVDLAQLKRFFVNPCRFLLRERLGLDLFAAGEDFDDVEPFIPGWSARTALARRLLPTLLAAENAGTTKTDAGDEGTDGDDGDDLLALAHAGGEYPVGSLGDGALQRELVSLRKFADRLNAAQARPRQPTHAVKLDFDLDGETWVLQAAFGALSAEGLVCQRYDDPRAGDYLAAWLDHLTLCAAPPPGVTCCTEALSREGGFILRPLLPADARAHLTGLLQQYRLGLQEPLRFFPKSAWEYVRVHSDDSGKALREAEKKWAEGDFPEQRDPAYRLALRGVDTALDERFEENARAVFGAMKECLEDVPPA